MNVAALVYGVIAIINVAWPRTPDAAWYDNWIIALSALVVIAIGLVYMTVHPLHDRSRERSREAQRPEKLLEALIGSNRNPAEMADLAKRRLRSKIPEPARQ